MITKVLGNVPVIKVLDFLRESIPMDYTMSEIEERTNVGYTALRRDFDCLLQGNMVVETRRIGGVQLYALNRSNPIVTAIMRFCNEISVREDTEHGTIEESTDDGIVFDVSSGRSFVSCGTETTLLPKEDFAREHGQDVISETSVDAEEPDHGGQET